MRAVVFFSAVLCVASSASAQVIRSFGSVVFPGGTWATTPGTVRNFGSVVFPGSSNVPPVRTGPAAPLTPAVIATGQLRNNNNQFGRGNGNGRFNNGRFNNGRFNNGNTNTFVYAYPFFIGGGYDTPFVGGGDPPAGPAVGPPPMAMYPPDMPRPAMVQVAPAMSAYQGAPGPGAANGGDDSAPDSERYLIAFKDHTVYSAVAYWFEGDTLHYFTPGNVHNQVSLSLVDRELTTRLNKELGIDFQIPAGK
jgi:hypothetical protein